MLPTRALALLTTLALADVQLGEAGSGAALAESFQPPSFQTGAGTPGGTVTPHSDGDDPVAPIWSEAELLATGRPARHRSASHSASEQFLVFESWGAGFNHYVSQAADADK